MLWAITAIILAAVVSWVIWREHKIIKRTHELAHYEPNQAGSFELGDPDNPRFRLLVLGDSIGCACGIGSFHNLVGGMMAEKLAENHHVISRQNLAFLDKCIKILCNNVITRRFMAPASRR